MPRRLLVASYFYPPDPSVGGNRWAAMTAYLRAAGHEVTVLTTSAYGALREDGDGVVRTADLQTSPALRRLLRRPAVTADPTAGAKGGALADAGAPPRLLNQGLVPDAHVVTWLPSAARAARRLVAERDIDCVITSAPPDSVALLPLLLGRRRPAWIADFRDGWRYEPLRGDWPTRAQDRIDAALERRVARTADVVIGATRPIAKDFGHRLGAAAHHVPNGWDPRLDAGVAAATPPAGEPGTVRLVHTGQLSGPRGRDPRPLFAAMRRVVDTRGDDGRRLRLVLVGGLDAAEERMLAELDVRDLVEVTGQQPRLTAVAAQRAGDAVLLLTSPGHVSQATGKLYEYLASGVPVLALADGNEAARIIAETGTGVCVPPTDVAAIAGQLERLLDGELARDPSRVGALERYRYPSPSDDVGLLVEAAIERHGGRRR